MRGKEFIFRNATHLHVSEFHALIISHLKSIVAEGVEIKHVSDISSSNIDLHDSHKAYILINNVKLVMANSKNHPSHNPKRRLANMADANAESLDQVSTFQYLTPFTVNGGKAHAKSIDEQWMRSTTLHVKEPFPYILTRQQVYRREVTEFSPIEASMIDIDERIEAMEAEFDREIRSSSDTNNLMRIIQGTVLPQVSSTVLSRAAEHQLNSHCNEHCTVGADNR